MTDAEARLVAALRDDPRVVGIARLAKPHGETVIVASTWDGADALAERLEELAEVWMDGPLLVARQEGGPPSGPRRAHDRIDALGAVAERVQIEIVRISELQPSHAGERATALLDPRGLIAQWIEWSRGRPDREPSQEDGERGRAGGLLDVDDLIRSLVTHLAPGRRVVRYEGISGSLRQLVARQLRERLEYGPDVPKPLRERAEDVLAAIPHAASGIRTTGERARERFLAVADSEGFLGDRPLLEAAEATLREQSGREPLFVEGFALATFDQVEARYALGEPVGGCQPPLVPGVYVGIGVTPADHLEFWAAPCVSEPAGEYACVADTGERLVHPRTAGRDAILGALTDAVEDAHEALPALLRHARGAHRQILDDPREALRPLHLPRTFIEASGLHGALEPGTNRLFAALAMARAAGDMEPVVGRKLALAAGRCLLAAPEDDGTAC